MPLYRFLKVLYGPIEREQGRCIGSWEFRFKGCENEDKGKSRKRDGRRKKKRKRRKKLRTRQRQEEEDDEEIRE